MNKLIIVGNGFDLAHGLPTSYSSFLDYIWKKIGESKSNPLFQQLFEINFGHFSDSYLNYDDFSTKVRDYDSALYRVHDSNLYGRSSFTVYYNKSETIFKFKNKFFELITVHNATNWVDIENLYYKVLISLVRNDKLFRDIRSIKQLNDEFLQIKELLKSYLQSEVESKFYFDNEIDDCRAIVDLFRYQYKALHNNENHKYFLEFPSDYRSELINFEKRFYNNQGGSAAYGHENLFLDFNYTSNIQNYVKIINQEDNSSYGRAAQIQIHGNFNDQANKLNFGFGDEMDDNYKIIENIDDNNYLENIKSFMYLNNANYKNLLNWIESQEFQVYIMGHSCGLSDRTLLNTIFEHHNCKSIKIFYYEKSPGVDNFTEISQNLSRHFNKKALMRSKVVNKELSRSLPQNIRYRKNFWGKP